MSPRTWGSRSHVRHGPAITTRRIGDVLVIVIDEPPVNALTASVRTGLLDAVREVAADRSVVGAIITGVGSRFVAGADLREMDSPQDGPSLPEVVAAIDALDPVVVVAITGPALGGGLEIALACDWPMATPNASVGLPETRLGLLPGAGGTQRLPRLVGIARAIELIGAARVLGAGEARDLGILDAVVEDNLVDRAVALVPGLRKRRVSELPAPPEDPQADRAAAAAVIKRAKGTPSVAEAVDIVLATATMSFEAGLQRERAAFLGFRASPESRALRHLFVAERQAAKVPGLQGAVARPIDRVAVIGAGLMGSAIASTLADAGIAVELLEQGADAAKRGAGRVRDLYRRQVERGRLTEAVAAERCDRIRVDDDFDALAEVDVVIEAAFEDFDVKRDIFARLDRLTRPGTVLATNTSYLDVNAIADSTTRPRDVLGLHFFSPANVMRLVEVVRAAQTAPDVLATGIALARRIGKLPVVAGVCDGFIGNRMFARIRQASEYLLEDGASPQEVDAALEGYGYAMGPFAVADMTGLDIAWARRKRHARSPDERYVTIPDRLCEAGRLGRKVGRGWFDYASGTAQPAAEVDAIIDEERARRGARTASLTVGDIQRRVLAALVNEGANILDEGISLRSSDIDLVYVNGFGFPSLRGGPMFAADQAGLAGILDNVERAHAEGSGAKPAPLLVRLVHERRAFGD